MGPGFLHTHDFPHFVDCYQPLCVFQYGVYGDLVLIYPKPNSIYLKGDYRAWGSFPGRAGE